MQLDLSNIKEAGSHKSIKKRVNLPDLTFRNQVIETPSPFQLVLDILTTRDSYVLTGSLRGVLLLNCSRCLKPFDFEVDIELAEEIMKDEVKDPRTFDLTSLFIENILLAIPIKPICSEDCQGLCSICGQNLNEGECDCEQETIDPRFAKLKHYFDDDND